MTKDERIAKLLEALELISNMPDGTTARNVARKALSLPSSSEPPQPGEITDEQVERALSTYYGYQSIPQWAEENGAWDRRLEYMRAALQAALGAKP